MITGDKKIYRPFELSEFGWSIAEGKGADYVFEVRFRRFPRDFSRVSYPLRINLFWGMSNPLDSGLASAIDIVEMRKFEDRLVRIVEMQTSALLAAVVTGRGEREFVFFAKSAESFTRSLNEIPQESSRYPIEIFSTDDPCWSYLDDLLGNAKEKMGAPPAPI